jgi:hypothetical protein
VSRVEETVQDKGDDKGHSGRLLLRMPRALHADLAQAAERRGVSLNQFIVGLLSGSIEHGPPAPGKTAATPAEGDRRLRIALAVNLVVLVIVGAIALALLAVAWHDGF